MTPKEVIEFSKARGGGFSLWTSRTGQVQSVNSAAPSIYAKEMRDFLEAHRRALGIDHDPTQDAPVIVSVTSTADWATGIIHPIEVHDDHIGDHRCGQRDRDAHIGGPQVAIMTADAPPLPKGPMRRLDIGGIGVESEGRTVITK